MRVLWISPGFPGDEYDLNCLPPLQLLAQALSDKGIGLQILTLGYPFHSRLYHWHNIPVLSGFGWNRNRMRWLNWIRVLRYARAAHRAQKFDLIHSFWLGPSWLIGLYLKRIWGIPHYTTLMGQDVLKKNGYLRLLKESRGLVAVSDFQNDIFEKTTGLRAQEVIPWGLAGAEMPGHFPETRPVDVLGCGAFIPLKNWTLWLQVVAGAAKYKPGLRAELIGDGPEKSSIEAQIRSMGMEDRISLSGHIPRPEVLARMRTAKVFLHTSGFESFGMVLAEAAMQGCRVLGTPVGILPQIGVTADTAHNLLAHLCQALEESEAARPEITLSIEQTAAAYLNLYQGKLQP